jgi:hypothetical protein
MLAALCLLLAGCGEFKLLPKSTYKVRVITPRGTVFKEFEISCGSTPRKLTTSGGNIYIRWHNKLDPSFNDGCDFHDLEDLPVGWNYDIQLQLEQKDDHAPLFPLSQGACDG